MVKDGEDKHGLQTTNLKNLGTSFEDVQIMTTLLQPQNLNSHLLLLFISYRFGGKKLIKYPVKSSFVIMSVIPMTTTVLQSINITRRNLMLITHRA